MAAPSFDESSKSLPPSVFPKILTAWEAIPLVVDQRHCGSHHYSFLNPPCYSDIGNRHDSSPVAAIFGMALSTNTNRQCHLLIRVLMVGTAASEVPSVTMSTKETSRAFCLAWAWHCFNLATFLVRLLWKRDTPTHQHCLILQCCLVRLKKKEMSTCLQLTW